MACIKNYVGQDLAIGIVRYRDRELTNLDRLETSCIKKIIIIACESGNSLGLYWGRQN